MAATGGAVALAAGVAVAALALRLGGLGRVAPDPFYDAAVRSMGTSWHNFLFGALEPGGSVAIDKPAVALWPQVAATRLLGFTTPALLLPSALAGLAGVALLYRLGSALWGRAAGLAAAAALAVAPLAVLTDRSDTMDSLAVAFALLSAVALVAATRSEEADASRGRWLIAGAGAAVGAAFAVKLFQALIPVPALAVLYLAASPLRVGERLSRLVLWSAVAAAVGLSWFLVVSTAPGREQPWAFGSRDGSALSAAFAYDGIDRLGSGTRGGEAAATASAARRSGGSAAASAGRRTGGGAAASAGRRTGGGAAASAGRRTGGGAAASAARRSGGSAAHRAAVADAAAPVSGDPLASGDAVTAPPGPLRLVARGGDLRGLLGVELIPALVAGLLAAAIAARSHSRRGRAGALFVATWLLTGALLLSALPDLKVRYVDVLAPPVALALGAGLVALTARLPGVLAAALIAVLLAVPAVRAVDVVQDGSSDSGHLGALTTAQAKHLSAFLATRTKTDRYELASATAAKAAPLVERDARPVLLLGAELGHPLTPLKRLRNDVRRGEVRYVLMAGRCGPHSATTTAGCGKAARWARVHGRDVSRQAGLKPHTLYALATHRRLSARRYPRTRRCPSRSSSSTTSRRCVRR